jgi:hypothetical protein
MTCRKYCARLTIHEGGDVQTNRLSSSAAPMSTRYENVWGHESNPSHNCDPRDESAYDADFLFEDFSSQRRNSSSQGSASDRDLEVCTHSHWNARSKKYRRNRICRCQCEQCKIDCADNDSYPMSRGGRGRGRGSRPNIPGYDYDTSLTIDSKPSELFPVSRKISTRAMV